MMINKKSLSYKLGKGLINLTLGTAVRVTAGAVGGVGSVLKEVGVPVDKMGAYVKAKVEQGKEYIKASMAKEEEPQA